MSLTIAKAVLAGAVLAGSVLVGACGMPAPRELVIFAAASLRDAFETERAAFEAENPGVEVQLQFAGSQELAARLRLGARADVIATADWPTLDVLHADGLTASPRDLAGNHLIIAVHPSAATRVRAFDDLPRAGRLGLGAPSAPVGRYADAAIAAAGATLGEEFLREVRAAVTTREPNARQLLARLRLGELDAAILYATDAQAAPELLTFALPNAIAPPVKLAIAETTAPDRHPLSAAWVARLTSPAGQAALTAAGFVATSPSAGTDARHVAPDTSSTP